MKKIFNKLFLSLVAVIFCVDYYKAPLPPPPSGGPPGGGGGGGYTPGAAASPIDMYLLVLVAVALVLMFVYSKKIKSKEII